MDDEFLRYYENELDELRRASKRFASEYPKVARRLQLGEGESPDPYVERLLEGVAFLTARIARKMDDGLEEFPEEILNRIAPEYNAPVASRAVIQITPDAETSHLPTGFVFEVPTSLPEKTVCCYALREDVTFSGLQVLRTRYTETELLPVARRHGVGAVGGVELVLQCTHGSGEDVRFFVNLPESAAGVLMHALLTDCTGVLLRCGEEERILPASVLTEDLMESPDGGLSPIAEYFLLPEQQAFLSVRGLRSLLPADGECSVVLMLRKALPERLRLLLREAPALQTNCARVINAFKRRMDRVIPSWRDAEHLVADATAASDYEVLQVYKGAAYTEENEKLFDIYPFYTASDEAMPTGKERLDYMSLHRARPIAPPRGRLSSYVGSEAYLRFSGPGYTQYRDQIGSISVSGLCSNRDLPLFVRKDSTLSAPGATARFLAGPTFPQGSLLENAARWVGLALARLNPGTLAAYGSDALPGVLRMLLEHQHTGLQAAQQLIQGIETAKIDTTTRTLAVQGDLCVVRGWRIHVGLNDKVYGDGIYMFARSLAAWLLDLCELNSFIEVCISASTQPLHSWFRQAARA